MIGYSTASVVAFRTATAEWDSFLRVRVKRYQSRAEKSYSAHVSVSTYCCTRALVLMRTWPRFIYLKEGS